MPPLTQDQSDFVNRFIGGAAALEPGAAAPPPPEHGPAVNAEENARLDDLSSEELAQTDLTQADTAALFDKDYMSALRTAEIKGDTTIVNSPCSSGGT